MGSDAPAKIAEATIRFSSSIPGPVKKMLKKYTSSYQYEWNGPITFVHKRENDRHRTSKRTSQSLPRNRVDGDNFDENDESVLDNEDSFSSFLPSSIGDNISKSFDWALETTTMQTCQNPFESFCFPLNFPNSPNEDGSTAQEREQSEENGHGEEVVHRIPFSESDDHIDVNHEEEHQPYIPLRLPSACEYCGSPSIRICYKFDANCRRPKTFFPRVKPPFSRRTERPMPYQ
mmetsp:Transcript_26350/g.61735  ORF Transcript_26350/g.61735 Transcript_26350/m.61735 type:complete len:232 (+) Transcript_26350:135-830(+)